MAIERVDKFDIMRLAQGNTVSDIRNSKDKLQETEMAVAIIDKKLCVKIGNEIYSVQMQLETTRFEEFFVGDKDA